MLTQKLQLDDLQFEKGTFDGTRAYAQQKRQQVAITEEWSKMHSNIHFSTTHPGWSDTPAVRSLQGFKIIIFLTKNAQLILPAGSFFAHLA